MGCFTKNRWVAYCLSVIMIVIIPVVALLIGIGHMFERRTASEDAAKMRLVKRELAHIAREGDNRYHIQKRLNHFYGLLSEEEFDRQTIVKSVADLKSDGMEFLNVRFYNHALQPVELPGDSAEYQVLTQRIFTALSQVEREGETTLLSRYRSFIQAFLGEADTLDVLYGKSELMRVMLVGHPGYFYWNTFHSRDEPSVFLGGMLVHFYEDQLNKTMALERLVERANMGWGGAKTFGCVVQDSVIAGNVRLIGASDNEMLTTLPLLRQMKSKFQKETMDGGFLYAVEYPDASTVLFAKTPSAKKNYDFYKMILRLLLGFGALASIKCFLSINFTKDVARVELAQFLDNSLLALGLVCLIIAMGGISLYVKSVADIQRIGAKERLKEVSEAMDSGYAAAVRELEARWREAKNTVVINELDSDALSLQLNMMIQNNELTRAFFVDRRGTMKLSAPALHDPKDLVHQLIPVISRRMFVARNDSDRGLQEQIQGMMVDSFAESVSEILTGGGRSANVFQAFEETGRLNELHLGNRRYYVFSEFIQPKAYVEPLLMILWHESEAFAGKYLYQTVRRNNEIPPDVQPMELAMVPVSKNLPPYPAEFLKYSFSIELSEHVVGSGVQQSVESDMGGEPWLIVASPLKQVPQYLLFAMYPSTAIDSYARALSGGLLFVAFALFIAFLYVGWGNGRVCNPKLHV